MSTPVEVLYIGGSPRSGSTLLARILGAVPGLVAVGELRHFLRKGYLELPDDVLCGCREPFACCPFWTAVRCELLTEMPELRVDEVATVARRIDRIRYLPAAYSPWTSRRFAADYRRFRAVVAALYRAIVVVSGARTVVDESKDLSFLYLLARHPEVDLRLVHLLRDSRGPAYSWTKSTRRPEIVGEERYMHRFSPTYSAADWWFRNTVLEILPPAARHSTRVRYEDFVQHPQEELERLLGALQLPVNGTVVHDGAVELDQDHLAAGNPSRFRHGRVELRLDDAWRRELPRAKRVWVTALTWPLLWRYGYLKRVRD